jgi:hypothetical protein
VKRFPVLSDGKQLFAHLFGTATFQVAHAGRMPAVPNVKDVSADCLEGIYGRTVSLRCIWIFYWTQEGDFMRIVDLSVPIGEATLSPPSVNLQLKMTSYHRGPGFWQASKIEMLLHTGSHVDFSKHTVEDGETAIDVALERVFGPALVIDLSHVGANHGISVADMEQYAQAVQPGDIALVRTDWTEKHWGNFPTY